MAVFKPFNGTPITNEPRKLVVPKTESFPLTDVARKYLNDIRLLNDETLEAYRVECDKDGRILIQFFDEKNNRVLVKFRHHLGELLTNKHGKTAKTFAEPSGKHILLGTHLLDPANGGLIFCFGEYDAMSVYQAGFRNVVSLPSGDKDLSFFFYQTDLLEKFDEFVLFPDNDDLPDSRSKAAKQAELKELVDKLGGDKCRVVQLEDYKTLKDPNELLVMHGEEAIRDAITNARYYYADEFIDAADVPEESVQFGTITGYSLLDKATRGFIKGQLVVVSGDNGAGKTTFALNIASHWVMLGEPVLVWSGEQRNSTLRDIFERIVVGTQDIQDVFDKHTGAVSFKPPSDLLEQIRNLYRGRLHFTTREIHDGKDYFRTAELAVKMLGCKLFIIDNLMAFTGGEGDNYFLSQADFVQSCKRFAMKWGVVVLLVTHNRKPSLESFDPPDKNAVEGSKKITNWADILLQLWRVPRREDPNEDNALQKRFDFASTVVNLCKNREGQNFLIDNLIFDPKSARFVEVAEFNEYYNQTGKVKGLFWREYDYFSRAREINQEKLLSEEDKDI